MHDIQEQLAIIWEALHAYREDLIPEGDELYDELWDDICLAMAVIHEELEISITSMEE
jgi:transcriptional regulator of met regulon